MAAAAADTAVAEAQEDPTEVIGVQVISVGLGLLRMLPMCHVFN